MKSDKLFRKVYLIFQLSVQFTLGSQEAQRFGFNPTLLTSLKSILIALLFPATLIPASLSGEKEELSIAKELTVSSGSKTLTLTDILVGEVWLCSGQSNMGLGLSKATGGVEAIANADHPRLRMFRVAQHPNYDPSDERDVTGEWLVCSPDALRNGGSFSEVGKGFSAVGFFFGRQLLETLDCPI
ncbi:MAG: hypothetical protein EBY62_13025, partial [Cellvibrionales bacterium]|nr:hypothetical protein [Cellvibrionales bacterium]